MSREWTPEELAAVSEAMKKAGYLSYEEFCDALREVNPSPAENVTEANAEKNTGK